MNRVVRFIAVKPMPLIVPRRLKSVFHDHIPSEVLLETTYTIPTCGHATYSRGGEVTIQLPIKL